MMTEPGNAIAPTADRSIVCYCGAPAVLRDSAILYNGRSYGPAWICSRYPECEGYVSAHRQTGVPLGTLCNHATRKERIRAHAVFDKAWRRGPEKIFAKRKDAYKWMKEAMSLSDEDNHIARMTVVQCRRLISLVSDLRNKQIKSASGAAEEILGSADLAPHNATPGYRFQRP